MKHKQSFSTQGIWFLHRCYGQGYTGQKLQNTYPTTVFSGAPTTALPLSLPPQNSPRITTPPPPRKASRQRSWTMSFRSCDLVLGSPGIRGRKRGKEEWWEREGECPRKEVLGGVRRNRNEVYRTWINQREKLQHIVILPLILPLPFSNPSPPSYAINPPAPNPHPLILDPPPSIHKTRRVSPARSLSKANFDVVGDTMFPER